MERILKRPALIIALLLVITLWALLEVSRLPVVTSIEALVRRDDPNRIFYSQFRDKFGADDAVVVAIGADNVFSYSVLKYVKDLTSRLEALDGVEDCLSLTSTETIRGGEDAFIVEPLMGGESVPQDASALSRIRDRAFRNPIILGTLVNRSANATLILIRTEGHSDDQAFESRLLGQVEEVIASLPAPPGVKGPFVAGWPVVDVKMASYMNKDVMTFVPISAALMCLTVYLFLGSWPFTVLVMTVMLLSLLWTMAALRLVGGAMSPLTSILPPLIMALSLSDGIHLTTIFFRERAIGPTIRQAWWPCFLTSLTTAIGFLSLLVSDIPAIRHFGMAASCGMAIELIITFLFLPVSIPFALRLGELPLEKKRAFPFSRFLKWASGAVLGLRPPILAVVALWVVLSILGMMRIEVDTNMLDYFYGSTPIRRATSFVDSVLGGANTIEVSLRMRGEGDFLDPGALKKIDDIAQWLKEQPGITKVIGINSFLKLMNREFHSGDTAYYVLPDSREMAAQYLLIYDGDELRHFSDPDHTWVRISARTNIHGTKALSALYGGLEKKMAALFKGSGIEARCTGKTYIFNSMANDIVASQVQSLCLAAVIVFGIMFLVLKELRLGMVSIVPNILPIIGNLGVMGLLGIPINTATAIISAVAIGIAVDDTIHFVVEYKKGRDRGLLDREAIEEAIVKKGRAAISTSFVLVVGFGILVVSNFIPTAQFGGLSAFIMLMALFADLFVLPVLLNRY